MRRSAKLVALAGSLLLGGCYTYAIPVTDRVMPASIVEVTLNDRGRVAMEANVGPEVLSVEGAVVSVSDSGFVLAVKKVVGLDRNSSNWSGEHVTFRNESVRHVRERKFSAGRTAFLVGAATASALAFVASGGLLDGIFGREGPTGGGGGGPVPDND